MLVIFGFGHKKNEERELDFAEHCNRCNNSSRWKLHKISHWFSLFFIPLIPFKNEYWKSCPICRQGVKLNYDKYFELENKAR